MALWIKNGAFEDMSGNPYAGNGIAAYNFTTRANNQIMCDVPGIANATSPYNSLFQINANSAQAVSCLSGYAINGSSMIQCRPDGTNTAAPTCDVPITCTVPKIDHATNGHDQQFTMNAGTTVNITCSTGYSIMGNSNISCDGSGHLPTQLPTCNRDPYITRTIPSISGSEVDIGSDITIVFSESLVKGGGSVKILDSPFKFKRNRI